MNNDSQLNNNSSQPKEEEIDVIKILNIVLRNKSLIAFFTIFLFAFSSIYAFSKKKIWEGGFQIVVREDQQKEMRSLSRASLLASLGGLSSSNLNTEVGIISSSSVLMPVYEDYIEERFKLNPDAKNISFFGFKSKMEVKLKKATAIVNITFQDKDKILIEKVLNKTIETYQDYSGKGKRRNLQLAENYLNQQIRFYKDKSSKSIKLAQKYALDQDLTMLDYGLDGGKTSAFSNFDPSSEGMSFISGLGAKTHNHVAGENVNIEIARVKAANLIRNIDIKIKKIQSLEENDGIDELSYINLTIPKINGNDTINDLTKLDLKILELESKYTGKFPELERLYEKRKLLIGLIKDKSIGLLKAQRVSAESVLEAATRPKGVLLKYKELVREANRDETTLVRLENDLRSTKLQQAKLEDPWELITSPTIKGKPVSPNVPLIILIGSLTGFILGYLISLLKEKKSGLIFEQDFLESLFNAKIIDNIDLKELNPKLTVGKFFIKDVFEQNQDKSFKFFYSKNLCKSDPKSLRLILENNKNNPTIISDFANIKDDEIIIFVADIPGIAFEEVQKIKKQMETLNKKFFGIIIVKD